MGTFLLCAGARKVPPAMILHPIDLNEAEESVVENHAIKFPAPSEIIAATAYHEAAQCHDFAAFFQQFPISPDAAVYCAFKAQGKIWVPTTVPTGARAPPLFCHLLTSIIARRVATLSNTTSNAFVDNVRHLGTNTAVKHSESVIAAECAVLGITLNPAEPVASEYVFLGMSFRHHPDGNTVALSPKTKEKLKSSCISTDPRPMRDHLKIFGVCVWASAIMATTLASRYVVIKFVRRKCHYATEKSKTKVGIWPCAIGEWRAWIQELLSSEPRACTTVNAPLQLTLVTDASKIGWGAIRLGEGSYSCVGGKWDSDTAAKHINELELLALVIAADKLLREPAAVTVWVDNTTVRNQLQKGHSKVWRANQLLLRFLERNKRHGCQIVQVNWIASEENPADPISRGMAPDTGLIETFVASGTRNSTTSAPLDDAEKQKSN
jgi:ribonuclease HI